MGLRRAYRASIGYGIGSRTVMISPSGWRRFKDAAQPEPGYIRYNNPRRIAWAVIQGLS
jgi:hypothetical protein